MSLYHTLFHEETNKISLQMFRYVLVTLLSYAVDAVLLFIFTEFFHIYYLVSSILSSLCGGLVNYSLSISPKMFGRSAIKNKFYEFTIFTAIGGVGLALNLFVMWLFTDVCGLHYMVSKVFSIVIVFLWTFFARRMMFVYKREKVTTSCNNTIK